MTRPDPPVDPVVKLALAVEKCLIGLAAAVGEFRENYRPPISPPVTPPVQIKCESAVPIQVVDSAILEKKFLNAAETAALLGFKVETLHTWRRTGLKGPRSYGKGKAIRWLRSEVEAWITSQARETADSMGTKRKKKGQTND